MEHRLGAVGGGERDRSSRDALRRVLGRRIPQVKARDRQAPTLTPQQGHDWWPPSGELFATRRASSNSPQGITRSAPAAKAAVIVVVARNTSITITVAPQTRRAW